MITVASLLWDKNAKSYAFSTMYDEKWVVRLYEGFKRNLTVPWRFVLFTDRKRDLPKEIKQEMLRAEVPDYSSCIEPFRFGTPMILVGLDTVIVGNIDHLAEYCLNEEILALPRDPYKPERSCNGVCLIPEGHQCVYRNWKGENDMEYLRKQDHVFIDDLFPGEVISYKVHIRSKPGSTIISEPENNPFTKARIVYFHGSDKPHEVTHLPWIKRHWLGE